MRNTLRDETFKNGQKMLAAIDATTQEPTEQIAVAYFDDQEMLNYGLKKLFHVITKACGGMSQRNARIL